MLRQLLWLLCGYSHRWDLERQEGPNKICFSPRWSDFLLFPPANSRETCSRMGVKTELGQQSQYQYCKYYIQRREYIQSRIIHLSVESLQFAFGKVLNNQSWSFLRYYDHSRRIPSFPFFLRTGPMCWRRMMRITSRIWGRWVFPPSWSHWSSGPQRP